MSYALYVLAFLWAFWAMYVLVMGIYRAHLSKRLTPVTLALSLPFVALGYVMDVLANVTVASIVLCCTKAMSYTTTAARATTTRWRGGIGSTLKQGTGVFWTAA